MALISCEDCGREVSTKAAACPHCGCPVPAQTDPPPPVTPAAPEPAAPPPLPDAWTRPQPAQNGPRIPLKQDRSLEKKVFLWVVGAVALLIVVAMCSSGGSSDDAAPSSTPTATPPAADPPVAAPAVTPEPPAEPAPPPEPPSRWMYSADKDDIDDATVYTAAVISTNTIELDFPYRGPQHGQLMLRRHPRHGRDVILTIERGQILCSTYSECKVLVRIDDGPIQRLQGNEPADNSSEVVFIPLYQTFMKKLPTAKKVRVQVQMFQAGEQTFEFDVSGFDPKKLSSS